MMQTATAGRLPALVQVWLDPGSVNSLLKTPGVGLGLAVVAVVGLVVGVLGAVRVESMRKAMAREGVEMREAVLQGIQTVLERLVPRTGTRDVADTSTDAPAGAGGATSTSQEIREGGEPLLLRPPLPAGVDAVGEVDLRDAGMALFVQSQARTGRRATLLVFRWHGFDLVPVAELHNSTGASFSTVAASRGVLISTIDADGSGRLTLTRYTFEGQSAYLLDSQLAHAGDIDGAFDRPNWAVSP